MKHKALWNILTPTQRDAVSDFFEGDNFELIIEIAKLNAAILKIIPAGTEDIDRWSLGQAEHFIDVRDYLEMIQYGYITKESNELHHAIKPDLEILRSQCSIGSEHVSRIRQESSGHNSPHSGNSRVKTNAAPNNRKGSKLPKEHKKAGKGCNAKQRCSNRKG